MENRASPSPEKMGFRLKWCMCFDEFCAAFFENLGDNLH